MTDPIQSTNPPQGSQQQGYTDDILGGEDIFAGIPKSSAEPVSQGIPEINLEEIAKVAPKTIPQTSPKIVLEKVIVPQSIPVVKEVKPQFVPVPKIEKSLDEEGDIEDEVVQEDILDETDTEESVTPQEIEDIEQESSLEEAKIESLWDTKIQSDVQKKFVELFFTTKKIYDSKKRLGVDEETFDILGADNDKIFISYRFLLDENVDPNLLITKIEQDKETEEELVNELKITFNEEKVSLEVVVNDVLLFDEKEDFAEDSKKKMQVMDKLNKFIFLTSEELRKLEKASKEREEEERERKKLQEIFRNF